ncbi:MAG: 6-bladed beta-propeller [Tannerella sp.]|jgi:hypothetical protein|nr:6-bladed beta-propeller [Tannerella sp.]
MKRINSIFAIILLLVVMTSCREKRHLGNDDIIIVDVTKGYSPQKDLILQDFMDVEYIPLETNDDFLNQGFVQDIGKEIIIVKNRIDDGNIYVYSRTGKALWKINRKGQGNEEYSYIFGIILDEDNKEIYVHNHYERNIQVYDLFGKYKRSLQYKEKTNNVSYSDIINYNKDNLICYDAYNKDRAFVLISKQDGSITQKINIPFEEIKFLRQVDTGRNASVTPGPYRKIFPYKGNWLLLELSSDTVYSFLPDYSLRPFLVRAPSIQSMEPEVFLILRLFSDRYYFMETIKNVYDFDTKRGFSKTFFMYDKQEKAFFGYAVYNGDFSTPKEIYMNALRPVNKEDVDSWQALDSHQLVEAYKKGELKGKLKEIAATLEDEDNPVIMLIKHKK